MIQPLRSAHRVVFHVLAWSLPLLVFGGLTARHRKPESQPQKPALTGNFLKSQKQLVNVRIDGGKLTVVAAGEFNYPETLVYLSGGGLVDPNSRLLGVFEPSHTNSYSLPSVDTHTRVVVFYSPALASVVDTAELGGVR